MDTVSGTWPEPTAGESTTCTRCAPPSGTIPNAAWSTPAMFTCTRFESGAVRPVTSTLSSSPGCAGRLESMVILSPPETLCTWGGPASMGRAIATVPTPFENFRTAGPASRPGLDETPEGVSLLQFGERITGRYAPRFQPV